MRSTGLGLKNYLLHVHTLFMHNLTTKKKKNGIERNMNGTMYLIEEIE